MIMGINIWHALVLGNNKEYTHLLPKVWKCLAMDTHVCGGVHVHAHNVYMCIVAAGSVCDECSNKHSMYMYVYMILTCTMYYK